MALKLALVIAIVYVASLLLRRANAGRLAASVGRLRVVETVALGQGRSLHVIAVGDRLLLVSATSQQVALLRDVTDDLGKEADAGTGSAPAGTFTQRLLEVMQRSASGPADQNETRRGNP
jgi:flagellar protein FliO/FliZ